ncbi:MAG: sulfotransferase [Deltaproteobacteria bacterium]|nr:sulfotransferase [Deltaproteobacteria bacterium]
MPDDIRIDDLSSPRLSEAQQAALAFGESLTIDLSVDSILQEAREKTGLGDFGPDDFLERLGLLVDEWSHDDGLTGIGHLTLRNKLLQHATSRLLIRDTWKRHPEIFDVEIAEPIIVVGLPRSGTTHLLNLMAADSRLRSLPLWESYEPVPMPGEPHPGDESDPRFQRCDQAWQASQQMVPHLAAMHPMNPDHIHEELELMGPDFASYNYEWLSHSPRWRDAYYDQDQTPHYEYMRDVLKLLLWQQRDTDRPTRWVLKCPQHLEQLRVLLGVFPDATIAVTHRDPVSVIQSAITMLAYGQRMSRERVMVAELAEYWADRVEHLLRACVRDRDAVAEDRSIDVPFHEFMADDLAMVERIYEKAGLFMTAAARADLQRFLDAHPRGKHGRVVYDLKADFGVDPDALRRRFDFYFERFPIRAEG